MDYHYHHTSHDGWVFPTKAEADSFAILWKNFIIAFGKTVKSKYEEARLGGTTSMFVVPVKEEGEDKPHKLVWTIAIVDPQHLANIDLLEQKVQQFWKENNIAGARYWIQSLSEGYSGEIDGMAWQTIRVVSDAAEWNGEAEEWVIPPQILAEQKLQWWEMVQDEMIEEMVQLRSERDQVTA